MNRMATVAGYFLVLSAAAVLGTLTVLWVVGSPGLTAAEVLRRHWPAVSISILLAAFGSGLLAAAEELDR